MSSGKDSAWTLYLLRQRSDCDIVGLLTTLNSEFDRVAMHGTRRSVLEAQAKAAELPLWIVALPWPCSNEIYEQRMKSICNRAVSEGVDAIAFGDLFLADIRAYREAQLRPTGLETLFPLWQQPTAALAGEMIAGGLRAKLSCVDTKQLPQSFVGREFNAALLDELPPETDPCGERGEFYSCVYAGPMLASPVPLRGESSIATGSLTPTSLLQRSPDDAETMTSPGNSAGRLNMRSSQHFPSRAWTALGFDYRCG